jgi:hypothetical protein
LARKYVDTSVSVMAIAGGKNTTNVVNRPPNATMQAGKAAELVILGLAMATLQ